MQAIGDNLVHAKLTDWANEPTLDILKSDLFSAKEYQRNFITKMDEWVTSYKAEVTDRKKGRSNVQPKLVRTTAEWRYPSLTEPLLSSEKLFEVRGRTFEDEDAAKQNELLLNYQFNTHMGKVHFIDMLVKSTVDEGTSIVKIGWKRRTKKVTKPVYEYTYYPIQNEEVLQEFMAIVELKQSNPRGYLESTDETLREAVNFYLEQGTPVIAEGIVVGSKEVEEVIENRPTVSVLNPRNVFIDPSCANNGGVDEAMFIVTSEEVSISDLKKDVAKYVNLDKVQWDALGSISDAEHITSTPQDFAFQDKARKKVIKYDYWGLYDIHDSGDLVPILVSWIGNVVIYMGESPFSDGKLPFVITVYSPKLREFYGEADAELLDDNQKIIGAVTRGMIDLFGKSANSQRGIAKGYLDPVNKKRYEAGMDYEFNPNTVSQAIIEHKFPEIPNSALTMLQLQNASAEAISGVKAFSQGMNSSAYGDVAIGIKNAVTAQGKREMAILRRLARTVSEIGKRIISMNADFLSDTEVVRVTNKNYVTIKREDLQGQFDLIIDIATAETEQAKAEKLAFLLQTIGNSMDGSITQMMLAEIADLNKLPSLAEKIRSYQPQPDPLQEKLRELEIKKLELELTELQSKINLNLAKAKEASSNADLKDLDFVQEETGVKHLREMDKAKGQARGNQELEITKALLTPDKDSKPDVTKAIGYKSLVDTDQI